MKKYCIDDIYTLKSLPTHTESPNIKSVPKDGKIMTSQNSYLAKIEETIITQHLRKIYGPIKRNGI